MKKLLIIPVAMLMAIGAGAQGTLGYANNSTSRVTANVGGTATVQTTASGDDIQMYYQADNGGAAPAAINTSGALGNWVAASITTIAGLPGGGEFAGPNLTLTGVAEGATAWIDIVGWNNSANAATLAAALGGGSTYFGSTAVFSVVTGAPHGSPPSTPTSIAAPFASAGGLELQPIPEPTTIALGGIGAASLLLFRRRK